MSLYNALSGRIVQAVAELEIVVNRVKDDLDKALRSGDQAYWDAAALNLHGFYSGVEHIFEDIARSVDASLPSGSEWHTVLLLQMSANIKDTRPAVISSRTRQCLDDYRGFRHIVRNVYTFNLRPSRIKELAEDLPACYDAVKQELSAFADFLENIDRDR